MSEEEEQPMFRCRKQLKSGMHWTEATTVLKKVNWPHEVVYTIAGKPATYQDLTIHLFIQGYVIIMEGEEGPSRQEWPPISRNSCQTQSCMGGIARGLTTGSGLISSSRADALCMMRQRRSHFVGLWCGTWPLHPSLPLSLPGPLAVGGSTRPQLSSTTLPD